MIRFVVKPRVVIFEYEPEFTTPEWIINELTSYREVTLSRGFTFTYEDLIGDLNIPVKSETGERIFRFRFATRNGGYFRIPGRVLGTDSEILIEEHISLSRKTFIAERNIGIFRRIAKLGPKQPIVIGGGLPDAIPESVFQSLLDRFPNRGELDRYANARVEVILGEHFDGMKSARDQYEIYLSRRKSSVGDAPLAETSLLQAEIDKFAYVRDMVREWLKAAASYSEHDWQKMIVKIILLIFPKYVAVLENVEIADFYTSPDRTTRRYIDICLVDAAGNLDVIEIKKPFDNALLRRSLYRDNNIPTRELSGSIMQAEKYLFHLSKWGVAGERELSRRYGATLPTPMPIRVTSPKAMIILGRDLGPDGQSALSESQLFDLEVIKRKYTNMMDILTYDELLRRLNNMIASLVKRMSEVKIWLAIAFSLSLPPVSPSFPS